MSGVEAPPAASGSAVASAAPAAAAPRRWSPKRRNLRGTLLITAVVLVAIMATLRAWQLPPFASSLQRTDNAYVRGRTVAVAPQVSGYVTAVLVGDFDHVTAAQPLVRIDDRNYRQRVALAHASLDSALAALANSDQAKAARAAGLQSQIANLAGARALLLQAKADLARINGLVTDGAVSRREQDQGVAALARAEAAVQQGSAAIDIARQEIRAVEVGRAGLEAQVASARAQLRLAEIDLEHTVIRAPEAGQIGEVGVRKGQYVSIGAQLLSLVPPERWVIANYKEAQTARMAPGQPARFTVDALSDVTFEGRVLELSPAAGSEFSVLKPDNAVGNFVKVPQRIGVRIAILPDQQAVERLRPGMSVYLAVETSERP